MSYLFIVVIGAIVGFVVGQYVKGTEHGSALDAAIGAVGAALAVVLSRVVGPPAAAGFVMSPIVAIIGAAVTLYATRIFMRGRQEPVKTPARRRY